MRILLVALLVLSNGCYYAFGTKSSGPRDTDCTHSRALPIVDTVFAVDGALSLGLGAFALARVKDDGSLPAGEARGLGTVLAISGAAMLAINGLSARAGYRDAGVCRSRRFWH